MLTVEIKLNGKVIARARVANTSGLADTSDYLCDWSELAEPELCIPYADGEFEIKGHHRRQTVWALVSKVAAAILGQKIERMEGGK